MSTIHDFTQAQLDGWVIDRHLGAGTFGSVWSAHRVCADGQGTERAAIKHISLPRGNSLDEAVSFSSEESAHAYYMAQLNDFRREVEAMIQLNDCRNIVAYKKDIVIPKSRFGYDIFIIMELLKCNLNNYILDMPGGKLTREQLIQLGLDISQALEDLQARNIIHRDVKPDNILVTDTGIFKLGDFGTVRIANGRSTASTKAGSPNYMAPEIVKNEHYNKTVDLYSLGLVLYKYLHGSLPFFEQCGNDSNRALVLRTSGNTLPSPAPHDAAFSAVVRKACAYRVEDRYQTAAEFTQALRALLDKPPVEEQTITVSTTIDFQATVLPQKTTAAVEAGEKTDRPAQAAAADALHSDDDSQHTRQPDEKRSKVPAVVAGVLTVAALAGGGAYLAKDVILPIMTPTETPIVTEAASTPEPTIEPTPEVTPTPEPTPTPVPLYIQNDIQMITLPEDLTATVGGMARFVAKANGSGVQYQWEYSDNNEDWIREAEGNDSELIVPTASELNGRRYRCIISNKFGSTVTTKEVQLTVIAVTDTPEPTAEPTPEPTAEPTPEPTPKSLMIVSQPDNVSTIVGTMVTFEVEAQGEELQYQWYYTDDEGNWTYSTEKEYKSPKIQFMAETNQNSRRYRCNVTDKNGRTISTRTVHLFVQPGPIVSQPQNTSVYGGQYAEFEIKTEGNGLTYEWQYTANGIDWQKVEEGEEESTKLKILASDQMDGYAYRCVVYNREGRTFVSTPAKLTIKKPTPLVITNHPADCIAYTNHDVDLKVEAEGDELTYRWQYSTDLENWKNSSAAKHDNALHFIPTLSSDGSYFRCAVTDIHGTTVYSNPAKITVRQGIRFNDLEKYLYRCSPGSFELRIGVNNDQDLKYQWEYSLDGEKWNSATTNGNKTNTLQIKSFSRYYRCVVTDTYNNTDVSEPIYIGVEQKYHDYTNSFTYLFVPTTPSPGIKPTPTPMPADSIPSKQQEIEIIRQPQKVISGVEELAVLSTDAKGDGLTYQWEYMADGIHWERWTDTYATNRILAFPAQQQYNNYSFRCVVKNKYGAEKVTEPAKVKVYSKLTILKQPENVTCYEGDTATLTVDVSHANVEYFWLCSEDGKQKWTFTLAMQGVNKKTLSIDTADPSTMSYYRCDIKDKQGHTVSSDVVCLTIKPCNTAIITQPQDVSTAPGQYIDFDIETKGDGLLYEWQYSTDGKKWERTYKSKDVSSKLQVFTSSKMDGMLYRCIVTDTHGHKFFSDPARLTIMEHTPLAITSQPQNVEFVVGESATFRVAATGDNLKYQWQYSPDGVTWIRTDKSIMPYLQVIASKQINNYRYRCVITDKYGDTVVSDAARLAVPTEHIVIFKQPEDLHTAIGRYASFDIIAAGDNVQYTWQYSQDGDNWTDVEEDGHADVLNVKVTAGVNNNRYRCVITDENGLSEVSQVAVLYIDAMPNAVFRIAKQPWIHDVSKNTGNPMGVNRKKASVSISVTGEQLTYQWMCSDNGKTWEEANMTGDTTPTITITTTARNYKKYFRCVITNVYGQSVASDSIVVELK